MALTTERIRFIADFEGSELIQGLRRAATEADRLAESGDRIAALDVIGDVALRRSAQLYDALKNITREASSMNEAVNFTQKVFEDAAPAIQQFAEGAAQIGFSKTSALQAAAALGVFGKTAGLAGDDLVDFTTELVHLAADMASIKDTTPEDAIVALGAAMRSEYEPLRRYGVVLNDVQLRERAFALRIYDGTGALNSSQRILAARAEVMAQLAFAQGDFIDTSDQLANSQRILQANMSNLRAEIGEGLLPVFIGLTQVATDVVQWFNTLSDGTKALIGRLALATTGALALVGAFTKLYTTLKAFSTITGLGALVGSLGGALPVAAATAGAALVTFGAIAYSTQQDAKDAAKAVDDLNEALERTRGDFERALDLEIRSKWDDKGLQNALKAAGVDFDKFAREAREAVQGSEREWAKFQETYDRIANELKSRGFQIYTNIPQALDDFEDLRNAYNKVRQAENEAKREQAATAAESKLQELELQRELERTAEAYQSEYRSAVRSRAEARQGVAEAQAELAKVQTKVQEEYAKAVERYNESLEDQQRALERQRVSVQRSYESISDAQEGVADAVQREADARLNVEDAIKGQALAARRLGEATEEAREASRDYDEATRAVSQAMRGFGRNSKEAADALEELDDAQRAVRSSQFGLEDSTLALADSQAELAKLRRYYGQTSSPYALRRIADAERDVARAQLDQEDAADALESATSDVQEAQREYNYTLNGYPITSDRVVKAIEEQDRALARLESANEGVASATDGLTNSTRAVEQAQRSAASASQGIIDAQNRVRDAQREATWAADDLRRAEADLANFMASGYPQLAVDNIRVAEQNLSLARRDLAAASYEAYAAQKQLNDFYRTSQYNVPTRATQYFMNGQPPAGSGGWGTRMEHNFNVTVNGLTDPIAMGRELTRIIDNYKRIIGWFN